MSSEVAPGVLVVETRVADGKTGVIAGDDVTLAVDAGIDDAEGAAVLEAARSLQLPTIVLTLTHGHVDHALGSTAFKGLEIIARPEISAHMTRQIDAWAERNEESPESLERRLGWPTSEARPDEVLDLGGRRAVLLDTPGHAPGATCVYDPDAGVLFGGDTVVTAIPPAFFDGDSGALEGTLRRLAALEIELLIPGHGAVIHGTTAASAAITWAADYLARCREHVAGHDGEDVEVVVASAPYDAFVGDHLRRDRHHNEARHERTIRQMLLERRGGAGN